MISLGSISSQWTVEAMQKYFDIVEHIDLRGMEVDLGQNEAKVLFEGKPLGDYDCVFIKGSFRYVQL